MKGTRISQYLTVVATGLGASLLVVGLVSAATTISTAITTAGNITTSAGNIEATAGNGTFGGTLGVTGQTTLVNASTTKISCLGNCAFGSTATTTISSAGAVAAQTVAVGGGTTQTSVIFGYCTVSSFSLNASTTDYATCTATPALTGASDRVLVQATSSIPEQLQIIAASSTAAGNIQILFLNNGIRAGNVSSQTFSLNFWAVK